MSKSHQAWVRRRSCTSKKRYQHQGQAQRAAEHVGINAYPCNYCHGWHLTSKPRAF